MSGWFPTVVNNESFETAYLHEDELHSSVLYPGMVFQHTQTNKFVVLYDPEIIEEWLSEDRHLYEYIIASGYGGISIKQRFYMDIDVKLEALNVTFENIINDAIVPIIAIISEHIESKLQCLVFTTGCDDVRIGIHLLFPQLITTDRLEFIDLYQHIIAELQKTNNQYHKFIDNLYKPKQAFRAPNQSKFSNQSRVKRLMMIIDEDGQKITDNDTLGRVSVFDQLVRPLCVNNTNNDDDDDGASAEKSLSKVISSSTLAEVMVSDESEREIINSIVRSFCKENYFRFRNIRYDAERKAYTIQFNRLKSSGCNICERTHDKDNSLKLVYYVNTGLVYEYCLRDTSKQSIVHKDWIKDDNKLREAVVLSTRAEAGNELVDISTIHRVEATNIGDFLDSEFPYVRKIIDDENKNVLPPIKDMLGENEGGVLYIHAPMKIGKTKTLFDFLKDFERNARFIILSFRILFTTEFVAKANKNADLNIVSYRDCPGRTIDMSTYPRVMIQIDSLFRLKLGKVPLDVVVLDESESLFQHFSSSTLQSNTNLSIIWGMLIDIIRRARYVIIMDANISPRTIKVINSILDIQPSKVLCVPQTYYFNTTITLNENKFKVTRNYAIWLGELYDAIITEQKNVVIPTTSIEIANMLEVLVRHCPDKKDAFIQYGIQMLVESDCKQSLNKFFGIVESLEQNNNLRVVSYTSLTNPKEKDEDLRNVNTAWKKYNVVIYTPTITSGISFEEKHFSKCMCWFTNTSCDVLSMFQMLGRVRNLEDKEIHILFCIKYNINDLYSLRPNTYRGAFDKQVKRDEMFSDVSLNVATAIRKIHDYDIFNKQSHDNIITLTTKPNSTTIDQTLPYYVLWFYNMVEMVKTRHFLFESFINLLLDSKCEISWEKIPNLKDRGSMLTHQQIKFYQSIEELKRMASKISENTIINNLVTSNDIFLRHIPYDNLDRPAFSYLKYDFKKLLFWPHVDYDLLFVHSRYSAGTVLRASLKDEMTKKLNDLYNNYSSTDNIITLHPSIVLEADNVHKTLRLNGNFTSMIFELEIGDSVSELSDVVSKLVDLRHRVPIEHNIAWKIILEPFITDQIDIKCVHKTLKRLLETVLTKKCLTGLERLKSVFKNVQLVRNFTEIENLEMNALINNMDPIKLLLSIFINIVQNRPFNKKIVQYFEDITGKMGISKNIPTGTRGITIQKMVRNDELLNVVLQHKETVIRNEREFNKFRNNLRIYNKDLFVATLGVRHLFRELFGLSPSFQLFKYNDIYYLYITSSKEIIENAAMMSYEYMWKPNLFPLEIDWNKYRVIQ